MLLSIVTNSIASDLTSLAALGDEDLRRMAERLAAALEPSVRNRLLEALNTAVAELNAQDGPGQIEIKLAGDDVALTWRDAPPPPLESPADLKARVALRLPDDAKSRIENCATSEGVSVNAWIVRALQIALDKSTTKVSSHGGKRLRGSGRS